MAKKSLVLFCSWSGNTRRVARIIAEKTGTDLRELQPETPYSRDRATVLSRAKREIQTKRHSSLRPMDMGWNAYGVICLGTPNWRPSIAPPASSFPREIMPADKSAAPFSTRGGGGEGHIARDVRFYRAGCDVRPLLPIRGDGGTQAETPVERWLKHIKP